MKHYMVDLETGGLRPNAALLSIGIVQFDETNIGRTFYVNVNLEDCKSLGLTVDESTMVWWSQQEASAKEALDHDQLPLIDALRAMNRFFDETGDPTKMRMWGNGAGYDNVLLKSAYLALDADEPWKFYHNRCYRTMKALFPLNTENQVSRVGTYHNALDDAMTQALTLQAICKQYSIPLS